MSAAEALVTVGVVTHPRRDDAFIRLLQYLAVAIARCPFGVALIVANNGGKGVGERVRATIDASPVATVVNLVSWCVIDSPSNNIAVGRNLVLDNTDTRWLAFIDDDERPRPDWLEVLVGTREALGVPIVAGPILPVFPPGTAHWIASMDVHNVRGLATGDPIRFAAGGNFLADLEAVGDTRMDTAFGYSGGEDTDFFLKLGVRGLAMRWVAEAIVDEDIPPEKATAAFTIRRCVEQGAYYRRIITRRGAVRSQWLFSLRAVLVGSAALALAAPLMLLRHRRAGDWMKRGLSNLGKLKPPGRSIYQ